MRMSYLIEACEAEVDGYFLYESGAKKLRLQNYTGQDIRQWRAKEAQKKERRQAEDRAQKNLSRALAIANRDPSKECPDGFRRNDKGRCQSIRSLERESSARPAKKPSLVDRMKSLFGKK